MNIYFTGAILGGRVNQSHYGEIVSILKKYGVVLSEHVADESLSEYGETNLEEKEIYDRELEMLMKSDVVVAEVTTPSLGVGHLIAQAAHLDKKVIALYNGEDTLKLSAMIRGNTKVKVFLYKTKEDLEKVFASELG